jgi:hypothetical protein
MLTLAWLFFRLFGWAKTIAVWQRRYGAAHEPQSRRDWEIAVLALDATVRQAATSHVLTMECKERAVCCWAFARRAGLPARLVVGIQLVPFAGHCWCESGPWTLSDERQRCDQYQPVVEYA